MVNGLLSFKQWFKGYEEYYTIIGGAACDILMSEAYLDFRATKDIDLVVIAEVIDADFGKIFWEYIKMAGYQHRKTNTGEPQFYRFNRPSTEEYPSMIEVFSRRPNMIKLPNEAVITPLPIDDEISSLSAILLNDEYYSLLIRGRTIVNEVNVLSPEYLILFKMKAYIDLFYKRQLGQQIDSKNIRKHQNDVFRLTELLIPNQIIDVSDSVIKDVEEFINYMKNKEIDVRKLGIVGKSKDDILKELSAIYKVNY